VLFFVGCVLFILIDIPYSRDKKNKRRQTKTSQLRCLQDTAVVMRMNKTQPTKNSTTVAVVFFVGCLLFIAVTTGGVLQTQSLCGFCWLCFVYPHNNIWCLIDTAVVLSFVVYFCLLSSQQGGGGVLYTVVELFLVPCVLFFCHENGSCAFLLVAFCVLP